MGLQKILAAFYNAVEIRVRLKEENQGFVCVIVGPPLPFDYARSLLVSDSPFDYHMY